MRRGGQALLGLALLVGSVVALGDVGGAKWQSASQSYRVYAHGSVNGIANFQQNVLPRVQEAYEVWDRSRVACTRWESTFSGTFTTPDGGHVPKRDGTRDLVWQGGANWRYGTGVLGITTSHYGGTGSVVDSDIEMNNRVYTSGTVNWFVGTPPSSGNYYDVESVLSHEVGHWLGLDHTDSARQAIMNPSIAPRQVKRALFPPDVNDVCAMYPAATMSGTQGSACAENIDCASASPVCRTGTGSAGGICTVECVGDPDCPATYTCQPSSPAGSTGKACLQPCVNASTCPATYACDNGVCRPPQVGDRCETTGVCPDCSVCIGTAQEAYCSACCGGGDAGTCAGCFTSGCGADEVCVGLTSGDDRVCVEDQGAGLCQTCATSADCKSSYFCFDGRCHDDCSPYAPDTCNACLAFNQNDGLCACPDEEAATGAPCGFLDGGIEVCRDGDVCIGSPDRCRTQCQPGGAACPGGEVCALSEGQYVCRPANEPGTICNACQGGSACEPGLACYQGRCYELCDTTAPLCQTCVGGFQNNVGACACQDQIRQPGESCGLVGNEVYDCEPGSECVQGTCRASCESAPCAMGFDCQMVELKRVCMPAPVVDAGTPDAGTQDAGVVTDAGAMPPDAGQGDAGMTSDAGSTSDAGMTPDAGSGADAGTTSDAGTDTDAGLAVEEDAGTSDGDAGTSDGGSVNAAPPATGCGCGAGAGGAGLPFLALALLALARTSRRREDETAA